MYLFAKLNKSEFDTQIIYNNIDKLCVYFVKNMPNDKNDMLHLKSRCMGIRRGLKGG
jgi:hypothetical protein